MKSYKILCKTLSNLNTRHSKLVLWSQRKRKMVILKRENQISFIGPKTEKISCSQSSTALSLLTDHEGKRTMFTDALGCWMPIFSSPFPMAISSVLILLHFFSGHFFFYSRGKGGGAEGEGRREYLCPFIFYFYFLFCVLRLFPPLSNLIIIIFSNFPFSCSHPVHTPSLPFSFPSLSVSVCIFSDGCT